MQGYVWAKTPEGELLVVLVQGQKGFVPGLEGAIELDEFFILAPVEWPKPDILQSRPLLPTRRGAPAPVAARGSNILPFAASA